MKKIKLLSLIVIIGLTVSNCGKQDEDADVAKVAVNPIPSQPVVIDSDFTYTLYYETDDNGNPKPVTETVDGPWFGASINIYNGSSYYLILMGVKFLVFGTKRGEATAVSSTHEWGPGDMNNNVDNITTNDTTVVAAIDPLNGVTLGTFPVGAIPLLTEPISPTDTSLNVERVTYTVLAEVSGYFTDPSAPAVPVKSFRKIIRFTAER